MLSGHLEQRAGVGYSKFSSTHKLSPGSLLLRRIAEEVCAEHGWNVAQLRSDYRRRPQVWWRQEFMWRAYQTRRFSYPTIARFLGKDWSTVIAGVRRHEERMAAR